MRRFRLAGLFVALGMFYFWSERIVGFEFTPTVSLVQKFFREKTGCLEAARFADGVIVGRLTHEEVPLHVFDIGVGDEGRFPQISFPFPVFLLKDVAFALFATQNLTGASHFEALGDGRSGF